MFRFNLRSGLQVSLGVLVAGAVFAQPATAADVKKPTFSKDVAPIFQSKCVNCHEPGSIAPMSLRTYEEARPWARSIKQMGLRAARARTAHRRTLAAALHRPRA